MCGIAGILYADGDRPVDPNRLKMMRDSIAHRGPDGGGYWSEASVGLVHRRLSIIDVVGGDQPIGNEDGSVQVVFNGEIYNFKELRRGLESRGHRFRTCSDTEVLVHLYEDEGEDLVHRLRGMFAFALWDRRKERLLLARDRVGIKPLYFFRDSAKIVFGSELKSVVSAPDVPRELSPEAVEDYLCFGMVSGSASILRNIEKLQPGHTLVVDRRNWYARPRCYWQLRVEAHEGRSAEEWQDCIISKLDETVRLHMISDVPVGAFLSGGIDSSAIVATASSQSSVPLQTFSIGFQEESFSELPHARLVAQKYGTRHVEEIVAPDAVSLLDELTHYFDEPLADPSAIPTYLVSRLAARSVKVVLSGDGGDEAFGGYTRYAHDLKEAAIRRWLPGWFRRCVLSPFARAWPKADWLPRPLRAKTLLTNLSLDASRAYANTLTLCRQPMRRRLMAADLAGRLNGHEPEQIVRAGHASAAGNDALAGMITADVATVLPDDFLVKVDRASMAHGLEVRPPLLDHELLELAARIPSRFKVRHGKTKWIFKQAVTKRLPAGLTRQPKRGFDMPIDTWLRGPLRDMFECTVLPSNSRVAGLLDQSQARQLYGSHLAGAGRHGAVLWALLVLAKWADRYLRVPASVN